MTKFEHEWAAPATELPEPSRPLQRALQIVEAGKRERQELRAEVERLRPRATTGYDFVSRQRDEALAERDQLRAEVEWLRERIEAVAGKLSVADRPETLEALVNELLDIATQEKDRYGAED